MKKIVTLLYLLLVIPIYSQWIQQATSSQSLNDIHCINENNVVAVGNIGTILKTTDGGTTWVQKASGTTHNLIKIQFTGVNVGYAIGRKAGENDILLKTIDAGENWNNVGLNEALFIYDISCVNENIFFATCYNSSSSKALYKSIDGGATFTVVPILFNQFIDKIQFINEQIGFASNYKTIDGGITWAPINTDFNVSTFFFLNEDIGFIYTMENGKYKTIDGGLTFTTIEEPNYMDFAIDLFSLNQNIVWELNYSDPLILDVPPVYCISKNTLNNTVNQNDDFCLTGNPGFVDEIYINALHFANETTGFAIGGWKGNYFGPTNGGYIYKNSTGNMAVNEVNKKQNLTVYPNPATSQITVSLAEMTSPSFEIEITNMLGKKVYSQSYQSINNVSIDTKAFSKGVYFLTAIQQDKKETQKIIID